jgi:hypothetical protein
MDASALLKGTGLSRTLRRDLLGGGCRLGRSGMRGLDAGQHRMSSTASLDQDGKPNRGEHEYDGSPGSHLGQQVGGSARAKRSLRSLTAKGASEIGTLALLKKNDPNQDEANNNVNRTN